jgi:hypothetical protein
MVDEEDKKEDSFEFDSAGEAAGYISSDQAQVLARRTARAEPGEYGSFAEFPMAFEVVEESETEDHYVVTLSFRPQGRFAGAPGREQFFITKEGTVADRQVLDLPRSRRRFPMPVIVVAAAIVVAVVIGGVALGGGMLGGGDSEATPTSAPVAVVVPTETPTATPTQIPASVPSPSPTHTDPCRRSRQLPLLPMLLHKAPFI